MILCTPALNKQGTIATPNPRGHFDHDLQHIDHGMMVLSFLVNGIQCSIALGFPLVGICNQS